MSHKDGPVARRRDYEVIEVEHGLAAGLVIAHHYAKGCANTSTLRHGLRRRSDGAIVGAALWMPPTATAAKALARRLLGTDLRHREVLVLSRLVYEGAPVIPVLWFLAMLSGVGFAILLGWLWIQSRRRKRMIWSSVAAPRSSNPT